jgi:hypothetical protein
MSERYWIDAPGSTVALVLLIGKRRPAPVSGWASVERGATTRRRSR